MPAKQAQLAIERVEGTPTSEIVCDYDELDEIVSAELGDITTASGSALTVDSFAAALVDACECDIVKYTDYYRISRV